MAPKKVRVSDTIISYLENKLERKKREKSAIESELSLLDLRIDDFDSLIKEVDREALNSSNVLNEGISNVKSQYDARISAGVRNNLVWKEVESPLNFSSSYREYEAVIDPDTQVSKNLHGLKYYRKPANKDYGSELIADFNGIISVGSSIVGVLPGSSIEDNLEAQSSGVFEEEFQIVRIGDIVTDDIESPSFFKLTNLPKIIGFGKTDYVAISTTPEYIIGGIPSGSTEFAHFGAGNTSNVVVGNYLISEDASVFDDQPYPPKIIGFGNTEVTLYYYNASGAFTSNQFPCRSFLLDKPSTKAVQEGRFYIGILSTINAYYLSTVSLASTTFESFDVYRYEDDGIERLEKLKNKKFRSKSPENPLRIGILDETILGRGSILEYANSGGKRKKEVKWNKYKFDKKGKRDKEPDIGGGSASYSEGNTSWPIMPTDNPFADPVYATEGQTIKVDISNPPGYTNTKPPGTPSAGSYNQAISKAEDELSTLESQDWEVSAQNAVMASMELRKERDELETYAWTLQMAAAKLGKKIARIERALRSIKNTNYVKYNLYKKIT